jgi:hypothetical protein
MYAELMLKLTQQQWQPIEAYPVLFYYARPYSFFSDLTRRKMQRELSTNIIYKN